MIHPNLKTLLDKQIVKYGSLEALNDKNPDPLMVAKKYNDETIALFCALFSYGNAKQIVKFLQSIDFSLFKCNEEQIQKGLSSHYYRFQKPQDVVDIFIALKRLKSESSIEDIIYSKYRQSNNIIDGIYTLIAKLKGLSRNKSQGYEFLVGNINTNSPYKRYMMFCRWMTRDDGFDMGLWSKIEKKDLILPLDTHTFHVCKQLGLISRKSYDLKSALEATQNLKNFDYYDPIKYDFALYRIGQEKNLDEIVKKLE